MARSKRRSTSIIPTLIIFGILLGLGGTTQGRLISRILTSTTEKSDLVSDGLDLPDSTSILRLPGGSIWGADETCEQTYGFLPCTTTTFGNLFLSMAYGFLMFKAATYLSAGSEMLLEIMGPGIVGGLFLPILGALPDAMLILVSGISGSKETAQSQVLIGMGLLAGSTVMLITILWGSCIVVGKCDISENGTAIDSQDSKGFHLFGSGITTDGQTSHAAKIMGLSLLPFVVVQLPKVFHFNSESGQRLAVLLALILSVALVISYCLYQVFQPVVQKRRLAYAKHKHVISGILTYAEKEALGRLLDSNGQPNIAAIEKLFRKIDLNGNGVVSRKELRAFIIGIKFEELDFDNDEALDDAVNKLILDFDSSGDNKIQLYEFSQGITKWLGEAKRTATPHSGRYSFKFINEFHSKSKEEHKSLAEGSDEAVESLENPGLMITKAVLLLVLGTVMAAIFADPLVDAVDGFSLATSIPGFFISFIAMPLATNSSEAVSALIFASRKKQRTSSLTFSEIYGGVTMNNTLCLAVFLSLVYVRQLTWDFSSEVLIILLVCVIMALFTSFRTTFPLWTCFIAYSLYPLSLLLVYILDYVFGWS